MPLNRYKILTIFIILITLFACSTPGLTYSSFAKVQKGMTEQEVIDILGEPTKVTSVNLDAGTIGSIFGVEALTGTNMIWDTNNAKADIVFVQGKVKSANFTNQF